MSKKVVIVDDSELQRMIIRDALSAFPCQIVGEADGGRSAIRLVAELTPDVIFLDMEMPGMTGLDVLRAIKVVAPRVVVFMITAIDSPAVIDDCLLAGAEDYIRKDRLETLAERAGTFLA